MAEVKSDGFDTDIQDLLDDLDETDETMGPEEPAEKPESIPIKGKSKPESEIEEIPKLKQTITIDPKQVDQVGSAAKKNEHEELLNKTMSNFGGMQDKIRQNLGEDRELLDKYISLFTDRISTDKDTKTCYVEAITALIGTKAATSMNATKLLDSLAKMVGAIKNLKMDSSGNTDLNKLLSDTGEDFNPDEP